jgi:hypothetical protein
MQFYNAALAIVAGCGAAAISFRLLPPLSPAYRTRRLLELTLFDLRRLASHDLHRRLEAWEGQIYSRLVALPDSAARAARYCAVGRYRDHPPSPPNFPTRLGLGARCRARGLGAGRYRAAIARFETLDHRLASLTEPEPLRSGTLRERGRIVLICDALVQHRAYFEAGALG